MGKVINFPEADGQEDAMSLALGAFRDLLAYARGTLDRDALDFFLWELGRRVEVERRRLHDAEEREQ